MTTIIYSASKIITMNPQCPTASHVAVSDGHILGVGTLDELARWGEYRLDERFADKVLMPGFVEGHAHSGAGSVWDGAGFAGSIRPIPMARSGRAEIRRGRS